MVVRAAVDRLAVGESFVLVAGRDPSRMCRTVAERTSAALQWTPLREGPGVWHVRVERKKP